MPYNRFTTRTSNRFHEDLQYEVECAQNEHLMEGIVAGCALVAYADGWVTPQEHDRMLGLMQKFKPIAVFGIADVIATFETFTQHFEVDQNEGENAALKAVARVKGTPRYPELLVETCCVIAAADGGFDAEERRMAVRICELLGLDPANFGLAEAP